MKTIKIIADKIEDEMEDVESYVDLAIENKETDADAYTTYITLANEEYNHAMKLHDLVTREIGKARKMLAERGEIPPQYMLTMWNEKHEEYIKKMAELKYQIDLAQKNIKMM